MLSTMVLWILAVTVGLLGCQGLVTEDRLITDLLTSYNKMARPATVDNPLVCVDHGLTLIRIENVEGDKVTLNAWLTQKWNDTRLVWNPSDYHNCTSINIPVSALWMPDIVLYTSTSLESEGMWQNLLTVVSNNGEVLVSPSSRLSTYCTVNEDGEVLTCTFKFGSWTYNGWKINVYNKDNAIYMSEFQDSDDWDVTDWTVKRNVMTYECCPEPFVTLTYTLVLKRKHHRHHCH